MVGHEEPEQRQAGHRVDDLERIGGSLCLDFANTMGGTREKPKEYLTGYPALVRWAELTGTVDEAGAGRLLGRAAEDRDGAAEALARAIDLRETIYRIFAAVARGEPAREGDLERLNAYLAPALARLRLTLEVDGYGWETVEEGVALERILWPVARDAAELLLSGDLDRVKECGGEDCAWLFVDASRNRSRRWCDMADCGNRAKARRHYGRLRRARRARAG